jgi:glycogen operon protein
MNMHWEPHTFELPALEGGWRWYVFANTGVASPHDTWPVGAETPLADQYRLPVGDRSVVILVGKPARH